MNEVEKKARELYPDEAYKNAIEIRKAFVKGYEYANQQPEVETLIKQLSETDKRVSEIFTRGGCYQFALFLQSQFGGDLVINRDKDHVALCVNGIVYDINGKCEDDGWDYLTDEETAECKEWSFEKNYLLTIGDCPNCEEPLIPDLKQPENQNK